MGRLWRQVDKPARCSINASMILFDPLSLSVPTGASTYQIGICTNIGGNASRTAISQQEGNISFSLGTIDYVNLIAGGQFSFSSLRATISFADRWLGSTYVWKWYAIYQCM